MTDACGYIAALFLQSSYLILRDARREHAT